MMDSLTWSAMSSAAVPWMQAIVPMVGLGLAVLMLTLIVFAAIKIFEPKGPEISNKQLVEMNFSASVFGGRRHNRQLFSNDIQVNSSEVVGGKDEPSS